MKRFVADGHCLLGAASPHASAQETAAKCAAIAVAVAAEEVTAAKDATAVAAAEWGGLREGDRGREKRG